MTQTLKILGQQYPSSTAEVDLYTVPASTSTAVSSVVICNQTGVAATFRISVAASGVAATNKQYIYYDVSVPANDTFTATLGITLGAGDVLRCRSGTGSALSFNAFGSENS